MSQFLASQTSTLILAQTRSPEGTTARDVEKTAVWKSPGRSVQEEGRKAAECQERQQKNATPTPTPIPTPELHFSCNKLRSKDTQPDPARKAQGANGTSGPPLPDIPLLTPTSCLANLCLFISRGKMD